MTYELVIQEPYKELPPKVGDRLIVTDAIVLASVEDELGRGTWRGSTHLTLERCQPCGHPVSAIVSDTDLGGEGCTSYCGACAKEAKT